MQASTRSSNRHPFHHASHEKVYRLHGWEKTLLVLLLVQLIFLPWALGGMRLWAQLISAGIAVLGFVVALIPRTYTAETSPVGPMILLPHRRLIRFPLFWIGLLLLGYIAVQAFNPAEQLYKMASSWFMLPLKHKSWLPHGTSTPFEMGGQWRAMMLVGTTWLTACSLWIGITRRRSLRILLLGLCISAVLLGILAAAQRLTGAKQIFWLIPSPNQIWGTFIYRNHGAAWFNLMVPLFLGLAFWHYVRALRHFAKSSPAPVFAFIGLLLGTGILASYSRGGVIALLFYCALFSVAFLIRHAALPAYPRKHLASVLMAAFFLTFVAVGWHGLNIQRTWDRMEQLFEDGEVSLGARELATKATLDMWRASPWTGHGAGSFKFVFPKYQKNYPEIFERKQRRKGQVISRRLLWEYAHNDMAQTLAEYGVIGSGLIVAALGWGLVAFHQRKAWLNPLSLSLLVGLAATLFHSWGEFVFQCPAILLTWAALGVIALRWAELDSPVNPDMEYTPAQSP